jgi:hypothetical protein
MSQILRDASFEEWIEFVFARPVNDPAWYWETDVDRWEGSPERTAELLAETFERSGEVLEPFDDEQVSQGLWYLANGRSSDIPFALLDETLPWLLREKGLENIFTLFRDVFAVRCSNHLGHLDESEASHLNGICHLWWATFPAKAQPDNPAAKDQDDLLLSVMERSLELPSDACRESALRGLGQWEPHYPDRIHESIDRFIWANRKIRAPLRHYAYAARHGDVV